MQSRNEEIRDAVRERPFRYLGGSGRFFFRLFFSVDVKAGLFFTLDLKPDFFSQTIEGQFFFFLIVMLGPW